MEDIQTLPVAKQRHIKTLENYKYRLSSDPYLRLIDSVRNSIRTTIN